MKDFTVVRRVVEKLIEDNYIGPLTLVFENTFLSAVDEEHIKIVDEGDIFVEAMEIGGTISNSSAVLILGIFTEVGQGTEPARIVATDLDAIFNIGVEGIAFGEREFRVVGLTESSPLYQHNLLVPYRHFLGQDDSN